MSFGTEKYLDIFPADAQRVVSGGAWGDWEIANESLQTVNTNVLLNIDHATAYAYVRPINVRPGCTRLWLRGSVGTASTTYTTDPIVVIVGVDGNGVPQRLDTDDCDAAGVTIDFAASTATFTSGARLWTDVLGGTSGYDLKGCRKVYILVSTAASITDGASQVTAYAHIKLGN